MATERENVLSDLTLADYDVAGNRFRAYFDADRNLIFVVDETINDIKPNVLLVMAPAQGRKWDDVLANDYGVDLETVRPKKDNKYQKLDIEYAGLDVYAALIADADANVDTGNALRRLDEFRYMVARRVAADRLAVAQVAAHNARDTIAKTHETIAELQARIKQLRAKLAGHKKEIGKEPTKQSAAKILRREAQIEATNEKLSRAKKRLASAQRRLVAAEDDAQIARDILDRAYIDPVTDGIASENTNSQAPLQISAAPQFAEISFSDASVGNLPAPTENGTDLQTDIISENAEPKAEIMADEEVKPLFDKDPEILDEEIAFKPIEFNVQPTTAAPAPRAVTPAPDAYEDVPAPAPLSFVPPTQTVADTVIVEQPVVNQTSPTPVLDTITSVAAPGGVDTIVEADVPIAQYVQPDASARSVRSEPVPPAQEYAAPRYDDYATAQPVTPKPVPMPDVSPAPAGSDLRPVSPITGKSVGSAAKKPTLMYYVMLVLLIALSIFTLWVYQKSASDNVPDLASAVKPEQTAPMPTENAPQQDDSPFIDVAAEPVKAPQPVETKTAPDPEPVVASEQSKPDDSVVVPVVEIEPEPVPVVVPEPVPVMEPEPVADETPFITPEPVADAPARVIPTDEEIMASKPGYNVSQQENMFVADDGYETETLLDNTVTTSGAGVTDVPSNADDAAVCANGGAPDNFGCCPGEIYTNNGNGQFMCCSADECFPPMF